MVVGLSLDCCVGLCFEVQSEVFVLYIGRPRSRPRGAYPEAWWARTKERRGGERDDDVVNRQREVSRGCEDSEVEARLSSLGFSLVDLELRWSWCLKASGWWAFEFRMMTKVPECILIATRCGCWKR